MLSKRDDRDQFFSVSLDGRFLYADVMVVLHIPEKGTNPIEGYLIVKGMKHPKFLIAISETNAEIVRKRYPDKEIHIVRPGIEAHPYIEHSKSDGIIISNIGGLSQKRSRRLPMLQVPKQIREALGDQKITFIHIGGKDTDNERQLRQECLNYNIEPIFKSNVPVSEIWDTYAKSDLYIYMSLEEGYSLTPMEALMMGVPCLISDIPVHREVYSNKEGVKFAENWKVTPDLIRGAISLGINKSYRDQVMDRTWDDAIEELDKVLRDISEKI